MCVSVCRRLGVRRATLLFSALALTGLVAPAAQASATEPGACDNAPLSRPFLDFGDANYYKLAPGGDFESSLGGWTVTGSGGLVPGGPPAGPTLPAGTSSLQLSAGASAQSPSTCVTTAYPRLRFFAVSDRPGSVIRVSVIYPSVLGTTALGVGDVVAGTSWTPTTAMPTLAAIAGLAGGTAPVQVRLTEVTGTSQVDDLFIDPHTMH